MGRSLVAGVMLLVSLCLLFWLKSPAKLPLRGSLTELGDIRIEYLEPQAAGISPMCGCRNEQEPSRWRGISLVSRDLTLSALTDGAPYTSFLVTGAFPGGITWTPWVFKLQAMAFAVDLPGASFTPQLLLESDASLVARGFRVRRLESHFVSLTTREALRVALLGPRPLAAWIPTSNAPVSIARKRAMFSDAGHVWTVVEKYDLDGELEGAEFPILDAIGPDTILWSEDPTATLVDDKTVLFAPGSAASPGTKRVIGIKVTKAPFAARIALMPIGEFDSSRAEGSPNSGLPFSRERRRGSAVLSVLPMPDDGRDFAQVSRSVLEAPLVVIRDIGLTPPFFRYAARDGSAIEPSAFPPGLGEIPEEAVKQHARLGMEFRYPPVPSLRGFNVFGPLRSLGISEAKGSVWIGSELFELAAPADIEIAGMERFESSSGVVTLPLQARESGAVLDFRTLAQLTVNGDVRSTPAEKHGLRKALEYFLILAAAFQMAAALVAIVQYMRP